MINKKFLKITSFLAFLALNVFLSIKIFGTYDVKAWIRSAGLSNNFGLLEGYKIYNMFYPPLSTLILWVVGKLANIKSFPSWINDYPTAQEIGSSYIPIKLSILFFMYLLILSVFFYEKYSHKWNVEIWFYKSLYIFANPVFILSTSVLGYLDILFAPFLFLSFVFIDRKKFYLSGIFLSIAFSIKLIPIFIVPIFLAYFTKINIAKRQLVFNWTGLRNFLLGIATVTMPIIYYFGLLSIINIFGVSAEHGANLSNHATNLNLLISTLLQSNTSPKIWVIISKVIFSLIAGVTIVKISIGKKTTESILLSSILLLYTYFIFFTGAHENHLFPALIAALSYFVIKPNSVSKTIFIHTSLILTLNLFIYYWFGNTLQNNIFTFTGPKNINMLTNLLAPIVSLYSLFLYAYLIKISFWGNQKHSQSRE